MTESWKLSFPCTRLEAEALNEDVAELALMEPAPVLMTEEPDESRPTEWMIHAYFEGRPSKDAVATIQSLIPSAAKAKPILERLPDEDWVTTSQQGIAPVSAGRFYVHTSTNKGDVPPGAKTFLIEASQAFGTGGHHTTEGCLWVLDQLHRAGHRFHNVADIGTGTGLLAFAALHLWPRTFALASDIDPVSIDVAEDNAKANGVALGRSKGQLVLCAAPGTDHALIRRRAPYDLLIANILAGPLIELAPSFASVMAEGGTLILAGLLDHQAETVASAYRGFGFRLAAQRDNGDWPCLTLIKRPRHGHRRPIRATGRTSQAPGDFGTW